MENKGKYQMLGIAAILAMAITIVVVYAGLGESVVASNATNTYLKEMVNGGENYANYIANATMWPIIRSCAVFVNDTHEVIICEYMN